MAGGALLAALLMGANPAAAEGKKLVLAIPGIPPIYSVTIAFVAEKQGFFKKYGADVTIKPFRQRHRRRARGRRRQHRHGVVADAAGDRADFQCRRAAGRRLWHARTRTGWSAPPKYGKTCKDIAGQDVGVDSINGARSIALRSMLAAGCKEVKIDQVKQIALGSSPGPAMIAGRLHYAVLHLDDLAEIEHQGKKLNILLAMKNTNPTSHYLMLVVRKDNLAKNRDAIVRSVAALDRGRAFHAGSEERRRGGGRGRGDWSQQGSEQGGTQGVSGNRFLGGEGRRFAARASWKPVAKLMKKIGSIKPDKEPVTFDNWSIPASGRTPTRW